MDIKKYGIVYGLILFVVIVFLLTRLYPNVTLMQLIGGRPFGTPLPTAPSASSTNTSAVTVIVSFPDTQTTYTDITAPNAYLALVEAVSQDGLEVTTKQYDFGVLVEKVGQYENNADRAWIYYVNGTAGDMAADKKILLAGDTVEWKYVKPE